MILHQVQKKLKNKNMCLYICLFIYLFIYLSIHLSIQIGTVLFYHKLGETLLQIGVAHYKFGQLSEIRQPLLEKREAIIRICSSK